MFDYYSSQAVDEQTLNELKVVKYVPLPPFDTLTRECRKRLPEVHLRIRDTPFVSEPEGGIASEIKRLKRDLIKRDNLPCMDEMSEKALKWAQSNNILSASSQVNPAANWFFEKRTVVDLEQNFNDMKDDVFDKLVDMAMREQINVTSDLCLVDNQVPVDSSSYACDDSFLWFNEQNLTLDHDIFKAFCEKILQRFERDYALELENLSNLSALLTKHEISSILEFLLKVRKLGREGTIYYYTAN